MNLDFIGPQIARAAGSGDFPEPNKVSIHGPNPPRNEKNPPEKITHGAVKFLGTLIVILCVIDELSTF